jgi:pimeloyl-ACP methyl ester carboxylesterase
MDFFPDIDKDALPRKTALVFLHGLFGGLGNFKAVVQQVQHEQPVLVPELPLFESDNVAPSLTGLLWWLDHLIGQMDFGKVCLVGNSLGGQLACLYAALRPEKVSGLVLTGAAGMGEQMTGISRPRRFDREYLRIKARQTFYALEPEDALIDSIANVLSCPHRVRRLLSLSRDSMRTRLESLLPSIQCPVHLIWGANDTITPPETASAFKNGLPAATLCLLPECGHAPMMEQPEFFTRELMWFLKNRLGHPETLLTL